MQLNVSRPEKVWNIITIGDGMVGKTCLLHRYVNEEFDIEYVPTVFDMKEFPINVGGRPHLVKLYDTAGQEEYDQLRKAFYKDADCFLICYSVDNRTSYNNIIPFWMKELPSEFKHIPIVLCATKIDRRRTNPQCITEQEGLELLMKIGATEYVECSAKTNAGVANAITTAVRTAIYETRKPLQSEAAQKNEINTNPPKQRQEPVNDRAIKICCLTCEIM